MTNYEQGSIVLIPFPFTDLSTLKQRPAVVLSSNEFNRTHPDLVAAAITSHIPEQTQPSDYMLASEDLDSAGLPKKSLIKLGKIVTLDRRLIHKQLGALPSATLKNVLVQFREAIF